MSENPDLQEPLAKLGIRAEDVTARLQVISEVKKARENYMLEKGISQNATNVKKKTLNTLSKWITQFFSISRNVFKAELRRRYSFRAVWLPGTDIKIGDILILKDGAISCRRFCFPG